MGRYFTEPVVKIRLLGALSCEGATIVGGISDALGVTGRLVTTLVDTFEEEPESFYGYYRDR